MPSSLKYDCGVGNVLIRYIPVVTGSISIIGSSLIIYPVLRQHGFKKAYHRFLFSLSVVDIIMSMRFIIFAILLNPYDHEPSLTCTLNGFGTMISLSAPLYNAALSIYFVLYIRFGVDELFLRKKVEAYVHTICIVYPMILAILGLFLSIYNPSSDPGAGNCVAEKYPADCGSKDVPCLRGEYAEIFVWLSGGIPLILVFVILISCNLIIFFFVRDIEINTTRYRPHNQVRRFSGIPGQDNQFKSKSVSISKATSKTYLVATQSFLYVFAYFLCWIWTLLTRALHMVDNREAEAFCTFEIIKQIFLPMQGFFNFLVYVRPKYLNWRKNFPTKSRFWSFTKATLALENSKKHKSRQDKSERISVIEKINCRKNYLHESLQDDIRNMVVELRVESTGSFCIDEIKIDQSSESNASAST